MATNPYVNKVVYGADTIIDISGTTATADKILQGYGAFGADGSWMDGTAVAGAGSAVSIVDTTDENGGTIRTITGVSLAGDTVTASHLETGYTAHDALGNPITGTMSPGGSPTLQTITKTYTPTESQQTETITAGAGYDGIEEVSVTVNAVESSYVGTGVSRKSSSDLTASGATVTAPAGYYQSAATKSVASGTAGTPTASKGTVSNHSVTVTPSVTNSTGYITGGTKTGMAVTVSASELVSGNKEITANGTNIDVADYSTVSVAVPSSGSSMNVQVAQSTTRVANTAYTKTAALTCSKTGTYDVYWDCWRSTTSGTSGSQLHVGGSTYGSANTTFSNHAQNNHLTGVSISSGQEVSVYVRSRATNYYAYCGQLTIIQTA
jgi:hypothetical protein